LHLNSSYIYIDNWPSWYLYITHMALPLVSISHRINEVKTNYVRTCTWGNKEMHLQEDQRDQADHHYHGHPMERDKQNHYSLKSPSATQIFIIYCLVFLIRPVIWVFTYSSTSCTRTTSLTGQTTWTLRDKKENRMERVRCTISVSGNYIYWIIRPFLTLGTHHWSRRTALTIRTCLTLEEKRGDWLDLPVALFAEKWVKWISPFSICAVNMFLNVS